MMTNCSDRWPQLLPCPMSRKPSAWRMIPCSGSVRVFTQDLAKGERIAATELEAGLLLREYVREI